MAPQILTALMLVAGAQAAPAEPTFPVSVDAVPGELTLRVFHHLPSGRQGPIPCWTYVTSGLARHRQKEIVLTVRQRAVERPADYPRDPIVLFTQVLALAKRGQLVDEGDLTQLGPQSRFLGRTDLTTLVYVNAGRPAGVEAPADALAAVVLVGEEGTVAQQYGFWRVLGQLASETREYPAPVWFDRDRAPLVSLKDLEGTVLSQMPRTLVPGTSVLMEKDTVTLRVRPRARGRIAEKMAQLKQDMIALLTGLDPAANALYVWRPQATRLEAVSPEGSDGSRVAGTFIAFLGGIEPPALRLTESGFTFMLSAAHWQQVKAALAKGQPLRLPDAGGRGASLVIEWVPDSYTSADGSTWRAAGGFETHEPTGGRREQTGPVALDHIVLLSSEAELRAAGVDADTLSAYMRALQQAAAGHFATRKAAGGLAVQVRLDAKAAEITVAPKEGLAAGALKGLREALAAVPPPRFRSTIGFELVFSLR